MLLLALAGSGRLLKEDAMSLQPGQNLSHYRLVEQIGEGGMGVVWKALDTTLDREVAIKVLPDAFAQDPDRLARFEREAKLLAALNHPHIAAIHGLHEAGGQRFLAMEMIEGEDLSQRLLAGPLPTDEALRFARQIAEGLEAAHESGIIHRDLKPANIKLTASGTVKILDFGLAKALEENIGPGNATQSPTLTAAATRDGVIMGTAAYMSPEQARGQVVDRRADIWAFGVVLFEMLGGRRLFDAGTVSDTLASILMKDPDWDSLPETTPLSVRRLLRRCLQKDARERLRDMGDARILIGEILHGTGEDDDLPATAEQLPPVQPAWRRGLPWGLAAVFLVAALVAGARILSTGTPEAPITRFSQTFPAEHQLALFDQPAVSISPDGRMLAFTVGTFGSSEIWLRDLESMEARRLNGTDGAKSPCFSPDGKWLAFFADGAVKKIAVAGGGAIALADATTNPRGLSWGDDDTILFAPATSTGLFRVAGSGGPVEEIILPDVEREERTFRWPESLPGGRGVLFSVGTVSSPEHYDDSPIEVLDLASGVRKVVVPGSSMARYVSTGHVVYARAGSLFAVPFDLDRLEVTGPPVPVLDGVLTLRNSGAVQFDIADNGTLIYVPGDERQTQRKLVWVDREGNIEDIQAPPRAYIQPNLSPDGKKLAVVVLGDKTQD
ncbi:MAG: protein kinase, partial [Acidobacteria bacterium]|nr:protein kinase [Acidobacteriota bacterium]